MRRYLQRRVSPPDVALVLDATVDAVRSRFGGDPPDVPMTLALARAELRRAGLGEGDAPIVGEGRTVRSALSLLRPADREVLMLAAWERLEPWAIAVVLGRSTGRVRQVVTRARRRLDRAYRAQGASAVPVDAFTALIAADPVPVHDRVGPARPTASSRPAPLIIAVVTAFALVVAIGIGTGPTEARRREVTALRFATALQNGDVAAVADMLHPDFTNYSFTDASVRGLAEFFGTGVDPRPAHWSCRDLGFGDFVVCDGGRPSSLFPSPVEPDVLRVTARDGLVIGFHTNRTADGWLQGLIDIAAAHDAMAFESACRAPHGTHLDSSVVLDAGCGTHLSAYVHELTG